MTYLDKNTQLNNNRRDKGQIDEKKVMKQLGAKPTLNSGAVNNDGDGRTDDTIFENKCGYKTLLLAQWAKKITNQARQFVPNKKRVISFDCNDEKWVALPLSEYQEMKGDQ